MVGEKTMDGTQGQHQSRFYHAISNHVLEVGTCTEDTLALLLVLRA